ncbi:hypothetical protein [Cecembia rubra]|uniref:hypothetical protein n=1 Tax=Cecembia rubra TaxID=1485585 RepID=UPI002715100B|nr:hypothetical protein [Cecembia rubra]
MKTLIKVLIVVIGCASCQTKEQEEIASLLGAIFERDVVRGDSVYLIQDAVLYWIGKETWRVHNAILNGWKIL